MKQGFVKVAAVTPEMKVADVAYNADMIMKAMDEAEERKVKLVVFPELCITGATCQDLFFQSVLLDSAKEQLERIIKHSERMDAVFFIGLPLEWNQKLYNVAAAIRAGKLLCFIPKQKFTDTRYFAPGMKKNVMVDWNGQQVPFGPHILLKSESVHNLVIACEIGEDLWVSDTPSTAHAMAGATVIVNPCAISAGVGASEYCKDLVRMTGARLLCAYILAGAGVGESTQDMVFSGQSLISENGSVLSESELFSTQMICNDIDVERLSMERKKNPTFQTETSDAYTVISFSQSMEETVLERRFEANPFVPADASLRMKRCEEVLLMQAHGLKKRLKHIGSQSVVLGISGGLDSTLALLVTVKAFDMLNIARGKITAVTMPCFGTTDRTYQNACKMVKTLGADLLEIDIKRSVLLHFEDIGHDVNKHDITYENSQARERTQILMDIANEKNGIVIGTGDMSELALGWATYNGDHMSMYGVNAGVPKTLVRYLVQFCADTCQDGELSNILKDVLDTPVSPELLPPEDGKISQKTEDIVGPYELHDFFLYYMVRMGFKPDKVYRIACLTFDGIYEKEVIAKWLKNFYRRFFISQFKRSCLPDGPKVGSVALSPRGDLRMASDSCGDVWYELCNRN